MKTFKNFLAEMNYGSLIDPDVYDSIDSADKALYKYTADSFTSLSHHIDVLQKRYPYEGGTLYRGLHFTNEETYLQFEANFKESNGEYESTTSWTPSISTAKDFAKSHKSYFPTPELMKASRETDDSGDYMSGFQGVILEVTVPANVGCDVSKSDFAKESEVILPPGKYDVKIKEYVMPLRRSHNTLEKVQKILDDLSKAKERTSELDKLAEYISRSWVSKLSPEQVDQYVKYRYKFIWEMTDAEIIEKSVSYGLSDDWFSKGDSQHLRLEVLPVLGKDMVEKCSVKTQSKITKLNKAIIKKAADNIKQLVSLDNFDKVDKFQIIGLDAFRELLPSETEKAVAPLKKALGERYRALNSREVSKTLKDRDSIDRHGKKVMAVIDAITKL